MAQSWQFNGKKGLTTKQKKTPINHWQLFHLQDPPPLISLHI